ncbi:MAG: hypothetical protein JWN60_886, partial [Acidobacteria bacterium]|nr:hypothetical protein [Acidobacteriota bacterium]
MQYVNSGRRLSFSFLTAIIVLFSVVSPAFGSIDSRAKQNIGEYAQQAPVNSARGDSHNHEQFNQTKEQGLFGFLTNKIASFFNSGETPQNLLNSQTNKAEALRLTESTVFEEFNSWLNVYRNSGAKASEEELIHGAQLAAERQEIIRQLIELDPQAALSKALSSDVSAALPAFISD